MTYARASDKTEHRTIERVSNTVAVVAKKTEAAPKAIKQAWRESRDIPLHYCTPKKIKLQPK